MPLLEKVPDWLGTAVVGAVFAGAGYAWKSLVEWRRRRWQERIGKIVRLQEMKVLLDISGKIFRVQLEQVQRLREMLEENHSGEFNRGQGYEDNMVRCYDSFSAEEKDLHGIIRFYTQHALRGVNQAMSEWLKQDTLFKTGIVTSRQQEELAERLRGLEIHLMLWHAKYEYWIPDNSRHALVYLADEQKHGLGFPRGIEELVKEVLTDLKKRRS
jgi:hypothetical protein